MIPNKQHPFLPVNATSAEIIAAKYETEVSDWSFRKPILEQWPEQFSRQIANNYAELYQREGRRIANLYMLDIKEDLCTATS